MDKISALMAKRDRARRDKDYELADHIREELKGRGVAVIDMPDGSILELASEAEKRHKQKRDDRIFGGWLLTLRRRGEGFARRG
jgi:hypothetical protein